MGNFWQREVVGARGEGASQARAVHEEFHAKLVGACAQGAELVFRVHAAELRGVAHIDGARAGHVVGERSVLGRDAGDLGGREEPIGVAAGQNLVPTGFERSRLMRVDVPVGRAHCRIVGSVEQAAEGNHVGRGATHHKVHVSLAFLQLAGFQDKLGGAGAVLVAGVSHALLGVGSYKRVEHLRASALRVVVAKQVHGGPF